MINSLVHFPGGAAIALGAAFAALPLASIAQTAGMIPMPKEHVQAIEAQGGLYDGPIATYVAQVGERAATAAGRAGQCGFHVLNSDVVNAFTSPPNCHVYITRGLLGILNSEGELAATLGHEVGHVAANHAGKRQTRSVLTGLGALVLGAVTKSQEVAQIASQVGQLNVLSYSRAQEFQADDLSVQYMARAGYSAYSMSDVLQELQRDETLETRLMGREGQSVPGWARTHPLTSDRVARSAAAAQKSGPRPPDLTATRGIYLAAVDGLTYGDDAGQGFVSGRSFAHPGLGIGFQAPEGFSLSNGVNAVTIAGSKGKAQFSTGRLGGGRLEDYAVSVLRQVIGQTPAQFGQTQSTRINGLDAVIAPALVTNQNGQQVEVLVAAYGVGGDAAYQFITQATAGSSNVFDPLIGSFHRLTAQESASLKAKRIEVVTVRAGDTVASLSQRMAFDTEREARFLMINGLDAGAVLKPGRKVKLVTFRK